MLLARHALERAIAAVDHQNDMINDLRKRTLSIMGFLVSGLLLILRSISQEGASVSCGAIVSSIVAGLSLAPGFYLLRPHPEWRAQDHPEDILHEEFQNLEGVDLIAELALAKGEDWDDNADIEDNLLDAYKALLAMTIVTAVVWVIVVW